MLYINNKKLIFLILFFSSFLLAENNIAENIQNKFVEQHPLLSTNVSTNATRNKINLAKNSTYTLNKESENSNFKPGTPQFIELMKYYKYNDTKKYNEMLELQAEKEIELQNNLLKTSSLVKGNALEENNFAKLNVCEIAFRSKKDELYNNGYKLGKKNTSILIEKKLKRLSKSFNKIFRIKDLYINEILEPPRISEERNNEILKNGNKYVKKEVKYIISKPSKFRNPLTWEDFILTNKNKKNMINKFENEYINNFYINSKCNGKDRDNLLIKFDKVFKNGYFDGREEIKMLYSVRFIKLQQYMEDLYNYHRLYLTKKINPPIINSIIVPIEANNNSMTLTEESFEIIKEAEFITNTKEWNTVVVKNNPLEILPNNIKK